MHQTIGHYRTIGRPEIDNRPHLQWMLKSSDLSTAMLRTAVQYVGLRLVRLVKIQVQSQHDTIKIKTAKLPIVMRHHQKQRFNANTTADIVHQLNDCIVELQNCRSWSQSWSRVLGLGLELCTWSWSRSWDIGLANITEKSSTETVCLISPWDWSTLYTSYVISESIRQPVPPTVTLSWEVQ